MKLRNLIQAQLIVLLCVSAVAKANCVSEGITFYDINCGENGQAEGIANAESAIYDDSMGVFTKTNSAIDGNRRAIVLKTIKGDFLSGDRKRRAAFVLIQLQDRDAQEIYWIRKENFTQTPKQAPNVGIDFSIF
jgi:hypothetical protein